GQAGPAAAQAQEQAGGSAAPRGKPGKNRRGRLAKMPLNDLLSAGRIAILSGTQDRAAVIDAASRLLATPVAADVLPPGSAEADLSLIGDSLHARERLASTAIGHGVAIPHGRVD